MVDFNLQIPANALTFTSLLALVWATTPQPRRAETRAAQDTPLPVPAHLNE